MAFARYAITAALLLPMVNRSAEKRSATIWGLAGGAAVGLGWIAYARSISQIDLATNGVAYMTYPLFALVAGRLLFARRATLRSAVGGLLIVLAACVALGPAAMLDVSPVLFIAPATFGFSVAVLTERLHTLDPFERLGAVTLGATGALAPFVVSTPIDQVVPTNLSGWVLLVCVAVGCGLVPMWVYGAAAPSIGSSRTAAAGAAELPTIFVIGALVYGESVSGSHLLAAVLITMSVLVTPCVRASHIEPDFDAPVSSKTSRAPATCFDRRGPVARAQDAMASSGARRLARHAGQAAANTPETAAAIPISTSEVEGSTRVISPPERAENTA